MSSNKREKTFNIPKEKAQGVTFTSRSKKGKSDKRNVGKESSFYKCKVRMWEKREKVV